MNAISKRVGKLEKRMGLGPESKQIVFIVTLAGWRPALDEDRCVQILRESGFLPTGPGFRLVRLGAMPKGLNAEELEKFLRERGGEICGYNPAAEQRAMKRAM